MFSSYAAVRALNEYKNFLSRANNYSKPSQNCGVRLNAGSKNIFFKERNSFGQIDNEARQYLM